jgi:hypothetical protein
MEKKEEKYFIKYKEKLKNNCVLMLLIKGKIS